MKSKLLTLTKNYGYLFVVATATFIIFRCIFFIGIIPSESMEPTLDVGSGVFADRTSNVSDFNRGDVIIFRSPEDGDTPWIKRVIGVAGDKVEIKNDGVYVNGSKTKEFTDYTPDYSEFIGKVYNVPEGKVFVLGDNRDNSEDARYWDDPYLGEEDIIAKAYFKYPLRLSCDSGFGTLNESITE